MLAEHRIQYRHHRTASRVVQDRVALFALTFRTVSLRTSLADLAALVADVDTSSQKDGDQDGWEDSTVRMKHGLPSYIFVCANMPIDEAAVGQTLIPV